MMRIVFSAICTRALQGDEGYKQ